MTDTTHISPVDPDTARGYRVSAKLLGTAILIEASIILSSLFAAWCFAEKYAGGTIAETQVAGLGFVNVFTVHSLDWQLAIIGGIALAVAELARLPLVHGFRTHASWIMRVTALIGVVICVAITAKSVTAVLQMAYAPRLHEVQRSMADLKVAEAELATIAARRGSADRALEPLQKRVDDANSRLSELNRNIATQGAAPKPRAEKKSVKGTCWNKRKTKKWSCPKTITVYVPVPWAGQQFADQLDDAIAERDAALAARDGAAGTVDAEVERIAVQEREITALRNAHREAVMNSQIHGLTAMLYGVDPIDVTEQDAHSFLRWFVMLPAAFIAIASSVLAMSAYTRIKQPRTVDIDNPAIAARVAHSVDHHLAKKAATA